ncbi:uncharacterized protein LOC134841953 [Symsagittifera roscoffensis]|uniref:uncharacterized protein LOC134841953 n=1 Tax=Symsagittifera roscoffensis TaxID=84072 RepID=UPI00307BA580
MYPDIIVDYVPGFKFKPCSKYGFTLNTLPKKSVMDGGNMRPHNFTTHGLPSLDILQAGIGSFPQWKEKPERNCSKKDCIVGVNCSEDGVENMGTVRSFLLAVAVSILFLLFFGAIVAIARVKARSLSGRDDTEFLYDDQDDDFQDEDEEHRAVRMNETEMTDVVQAPHKQQSQNGISSLANSGLAAQAGSSVYNVENNRISVQPSNAAPQGPPASSEFATSELGRD